MKKTFLAFLVPIGMLLAQDGTITGRIVSYQGVDQNSVVDAKVYVAYDSSGQLICEGETVTDENGMYRIDGLDDGIYRVEVSKQDYYTVSYPERVWVNQQAGTYGINFVLPSRSPFDTSNYFSGEVRLLDFYGDEWWGKVTVFSYHGYVISEDSLVPLTDTLGEPRDIAQFLIDTLPAEPLFITANVPSYVPQFYDHIYEAQENSGITPPLDSVDFDLERAIDTTLTGGISGVITGEHGPLPLASVYVVEDEQVVSGCMSDDDGSYWLPLQPGVYDVYATRAGYSRADYYEPVTVADEEVPDIDIYLSPWAPVGIEDEPEAQNPSISMSPNPFTSTVSITYNLNTPSHVSIKIYDKTGSKASQIVDENTPEGVHNLTWNGRDSRNQPLPSGVYFCRISIDGHATTRPLILVR